MRSFLLALIVLSSPAAAFSQTSTTSPRAPVDAATLRVTVVDPSGAVIVGANVEVDVAGETVRADTGARGDAVLTVRPGRYTVRAQSPGFEPNEARDVRVR